MNISTGTLCLRHCLKTTNDMVKIGQEILAAVRMDGSSLGLYITKKILDHDRIVYCKENTETGVCFRAVF